MTMRSSVRSAGAPSSLISAVGFGVDRNPDRPSSNRSRSNASTFAGIPAAASATSVCVMSIVHPSPNGNDRLSACVGCPAPTAGHSSAPPRLGLDGGRASRSASRGSSSDKSLEPEAGRVEDGVFDSSVATNDPICALTATRVPIRLRASNSDRSGLFSRAVGRQLRLRRVQAGELELLHRRMPLHPDTQHSAISVVAVEHRPERVTHVEGEVRAVEGPPFGGVSGIPTLDGESTEPYLQARISAWPSCSSA